MKRLLILLALFITPALTADAAPNLCAMTGNIEYIYGSPQAGVRVSYRGINAQNPSNGSGFIVPGQSACSVTSDVNGNLPTTGSCSSFIQGVKMYVTVGNGQPTLVQVPIASSVDLSTLILANTDPPSIVTSVASSNGNCSVTNPGTGSIGTSTITCGAGGGPWTLGPGQVQITANTPNSFETNNVNQILNPATFSGTHAFDKVQSAFNSTQCAATGCTIDMRGLGVASDTFTTPLVFTGKPVTLILDGNQTYSSGGLSVSTTSGSTTCSGTCTTTITTSANHGFSTGWTVKVTGASPQAYNGVFPITVTSANQFTYQPDATSTPSAISVQGTVEPGLIQFGSGTDGSEVACYGTTPHSTGQAGIPSTGNRQAVVALPSSGTMDILQVASGVQGFRVHGCNFVGNANMDDGISLGAGAINSGIWNNVISGVQPIALTATGGTGYAVHFDGRIADNSYVLMNQIYGWANGIWSDALNVGTAGGTFGPWISDNIIFEAGGTTGLYFIRASNSFDAWIDHNATGFSSLATNGRGIFVEGSGTDTPHIVSNHFDGSNNGGNSGIEDVNISSTAGGEISANSLNGNTNDSNSAHDPDHAIETGASANNVVIHGNNIANYSAGGITANGNTTNAIQVSNNTFTKGHAGTGSYIINYNGLASTYETRTLTLDGPAVAAEGAQVAFGKAGTNYGFVGNDSAVTGSGSNNGLSLFSQEFMRFYGNNSNTIAALLFNGLQVGSAPTGGDKGAGTINAASGYFNNGNSAVEGSINHSTGYEGSTFSTAGATLLVSCNKMLNAGKLTTLKCTSDIQGTCTTAPSFSTRDTTSTTNGSGTVACSNAAGTVTQSTPGLSFSAGDEVCITRTVNPNTCTTSQFGVDAHWSEP